MRRNKSLRDGRVLLLGFFRLGILKISGISSRVIIFFVSLLLRGISIMDHFHGILLSFISGMD